MGNIKTKFGICSINNQGYYHVTSNKEGNQGKLLHILIWEDWYGKSLPKGYDIHHLNKNRIDNRIQNLQCVEHKTHTSFHHKGKTISFDTRMKISNAQKEDKCWLYRKDVNPNYVKQEALKGKFNSQIAKELNCSTETIRRRLKKICTYEEYEKIKQNNYTNCIKN